MGKYDLRNLPIRLLVQIWRLELWFSTVSLMTIMQSEIVAVNPNNEDVHSCGGAAMERTEASEHTTMLFRVIGLIEFCFNRCIIFLTKRSNFRFGSGYRS